MLRQTHLALTLLAVLPLQAQTSQSASPQPPAPDAIYYHGSILTGVDLTTPHPQRVTALAVANGKVLSSGTDADTLKLKGPQTKLINLAGAFALPGLNDAHVHLGSGGRQKLAVDLTGSTSLADMQSRIHAAAAKAPPGTWLQGGGWDHTLWASKQLPTRADIDSITAGHPAFFVRVDGHIAIANTAALAAAGITAQTPDPQGGKFDHDALGGLTGIVREGTAMAMMTKVIPPPSLELRRKALALAIQDALSHGLTSVQDNSDWQDFLAVEELENNGQLHLRISEWLAFDQPTDVLKSRRASHPADDVLLHTGMLKGFMDGSLGSRTAAMNDAYSDDPGNSGIPRYDQQKLNLMAAERALAGFQLGFHAIGDRAATMALNAFQAAEQVAPDGSKSRFRIEHAQVIDAADFDRFATLGVIASMQPNHLLTDMNWAAQRLGPDRVKYSYAWKTFLDHHIVLAFGTDYPVEPITPYRGIYSAVTRMDEAGTQTYQPQEKLTIGQALYAYTQGSAFAEKRETIKGQLLPGYLADFTVLDRDLTTIPAADILKTQVLRTVVGGETVYQKP